MTPVSRPPRRAAALLPLALALQGCAELVTLDRTTTLRASQSLWAGAGLSSYGYTVTRECVCPAAAREPVRVEVRDGAPASATVLATGAPAPPEHFGAFDTVEELFAFVEQAVRDDAFAIQATYDDTRGFPVHAWVVYRRARSAADGGFTVTDFQER